MIHQKFVHPEDTTCINKQYSNNKWITFTVSMLILLSIACNNSSENPAEATIIAGKATSTALELENLKLKATIEAQEKNAPLEPRNTSKPPTGDDDAGEVVEFETPAVKPTPDNVLYFEDFSNNKNGWELKGKDNGSVSFIQQKLVISPDNSKCVVAPIPNFNVENEYYIESQVTILDPNFKNTAGRSTEGYIFGDEPAKYFKYGISGDIHGDSWKVQAFSPDETSFEASLPGQPWKEGQTFTLGMELLNGVYTLYLNGEMLASNQFNPDGKKIGVFACNTWGQDLGLASVDIHFDNLIIRESH